MVTGASDMNARGLLFFVAPLTGAALLAIVLAYGLATSFDYFSPMNDRTWLGFLGISFYQLIILGWFFSVDGSHLFHTLARAFLIRDVYRRHRKAILFSFLFFVAGPVAVVWPFLMGSAMGLEKENPVQQMFNAMPVILLAMYFIWAYWHVTQQHWGFVALRARLQGKAPAAAHRHYYVLSTAIPPIVFFLLDGHVALCRHTALSTAPILNRLGISRTEVIVAATTLLACGIIFMLLAGRGQDGRPRADGSSTFLLATSSALHLGVMSLGPLALFVHPIITIGHDLQYHCFCYLEGRHRARAMAPTAPQSTESHQDKAGQIFRWLHEHKWPIFAAALAFAFLSSAPFLLADVLAPFAAQLPWESAANNNLIQVGATTYFKPPPLEMQLINAFCIGFAAQHYYLDGKIWKFSKDESARNHVMAALAKNTQAQS